MVSKPTAISCVVPQFENCLNFLKWWTSSVKLEIFPLVLEKYEKRKSFMFLFGSNNCIHLFPGNTRTCTTFFYA